jgi:hypothetical protein
MTWDDWVSQKTVVVRRTRRKEVAPEGQMDGNLVEEALGQLRAFSLCNKACCGTAK